MASATASTVKLKVSKGAAETWVDADYHNFAAALAGSRGASEKDGFDLAAYILRGDPDAVKLKTSMTNSALSAFQKSSPDHIREGGQAARHPLVALVELRARARPHEVRVHRQVAQAEQREHLRGRDEPR